MSSRRIVASTVQLAAILMWIGWPDSPAAARATTDSPNTRAGQQAQAQPRDPRPDVPRPASAREVELKAATSADPANVANWIQLARLQETRGAIDDAQNTFKAALRATNAARPVAAAYAELLFRTGAFEPGMELFEQIANGTPGDPADHQRVATYYWDKAHRDHLLTPADKLKYIERGIAATDRALELKGDYVDALTYKNILLRMKANLEPDAANREALIAEAEALRNRALELNKARNVSGAAASSSAPPPPPAPAAPGVVDGRAPVRVGGTIKTPTKLHDVRPVYPQDALDARVSGMVILEAVIDTQGNVRDARVLRSIPMLDQAALDAVKQWRFTPTLLDGVPVPVMMTVTVSFTIQ